jgi:hypothetical protein
MGRYGKTFKKQHVIRWHWFCYAGYQDKIFPELNPLQMKRRQKVKKQFVSLMASLFLVISSAGLACALTITNGSFETGNLSGWIPTATTGNVSVVTTTQASDGTVYNPTDGNYFAKLVADSALLQMSLNWEAGDVISFSWAFLAFDYLPYNDFSVFSILTDSQDAFVLTLANVADVGDYGDTGWMKYSYTFQNSGSGNILFGANNLMDQSMQSVLLVDNVSTTATPEPATLLLLGSGMLGMAYLKKRKTA